jgi:hypothetical protein
MSLQAVLALPRQAAPSSWTDAFRHGPVFAATALVLIAMIPPTLMALALDPRLLDGVSVWIKPLKFELSIALYAGTLAWFMSFLPAQERDARRFRIWAIVVAAAAAIEMVWIAGAAYFGIASHFNRESSFMATIYPVMGAVAVTLSIPSLVMSRAFWRYRREAANPAFHLSLALGLILTFVLTVLVAGYMSNQTGHAVGTGQGSSVPVLGWSRTGGDLRVAHFFATHAMHFIPAFGWVAARLLPAARARQSVWIFAAAFTGFIAFTLVQAIMGRPLVG